MGLAGFGAHVGLAFQLTDDLLGIWGAPEVTGKPVRSDLRARKKSLPVVAALTSGTEAGRELAALLAQPEPLTEDELVARGRAGRGGRRPEWAETEADAGAGRRGPVPGRGRHARRRAGRVRGDRRVHHGAPVVRSHEPGRRMMTPRKLIFLIRGIRGETTVRVTGP